MTVFRKLYDKCGYRYASYFSMERANKSVYRC